VTAPTMTRTHGYVEGHTRAASGGKKWTFVCATGGRKRDGFALRPDGWRLESYHRNGGPVLWQHDHQRPPIGRARAYRAGNALKADVEFDQSDPFAQLVQSKIANGFVRQVSVGWDFVSPSTGDVLTHHRTSRDYLERSANYELNEISVVTVGADPDAVLELQRAWRRRPQQVDARDAAIVLAELDRALMDPDVRAEADAAEEWARLQYRQLMRGMEPSPRRIPRGR
jgi:HK97 family phage prohead protease